jgi:tRNA A37 threonylcarbamoyladenosine dehydratase
MDQPTPNIGSASTISESGNRMTDPSNPAHSVIFDIDPFEARFGGVQRLVGLSGARRLRQSHVCIVGLGGVGSWTAESLARTGIGQITLVDFDDVCISNINRQVHAIHGEFGQPKVQAMARRIQSINPDCVVHPVQTFFTAANADSILTGPYDYLCDAIDKPAMKSLLIDQCQLRRIPVISSGAAGGRRDPTAIRIADLARVTHDRLLLVVRNSLRSDYGFPPSPKTFGVDCVYSPEPVVYPHADGSVCHDRPTSPDLRLDCHSGYGTASFVTGAFGLAAAAYIVKHLTTNPRAQG